MMTLDKAGLMMTPDRSNHYLNKVGSHFSAIVISFLYLLQISLYICIALDCLYIYNAIVNDISISIVKLANIGPWLRENGVPLYNDDDNPFLEGSFLSCGKYT